MSEKQDPLVRALLERARKDGARPGQLARIEASLERAWWIQKWLPWSAAGAGGASVIVAFALLSQDPEARPETRREVVVAPVETPSGAEQSASLTPAPVNTALPPEVLETEPFAAPSAALSAEHVRPDELELLTRATSAWPTNPRAALASLRTHRELYPRGAYREERELLFIEFSEATCAQARSRIARFEQAFPASIHQARLARAEGRACLE